MGGSKCGLTSIASSGPLLATRLVSVSSQSTSFVIPPSGEYLSGVVESPAGMLQLPERPAQLDSYVPLRPPMRVLRDGKNEGRFEGRLGGGRDRSSSSSHRIGFEGSYGSRLPRVQSAG